MSDKIEQLKRYFLGDLTDAEIEAIDLKIISNSLISDDLIMAEQELIEDFLDGDLSEEDRELFNENYLITEERRLNVMTIRNLKKIATEIQLEAAPVGEHLQEEEGFFHNLKRLSSWRNFAFGLPVLLFIICGLLIWSFYFSEGTRLTPLEREYVQLNQRSLDDLSEFDDSSRIVLTSGKRRGSGSTSGEYLKQNFKRRVLINLALQSAVNGSDVFKVELTKNGKVIFTQTGIRVHKNEFGKELRFILPAQILDSGNYQLLGKGNSAEFSYAFSVR